MDRIKLGDPQPKPCNKCNYFHGYKTLDAVKGYYESFYTSDGESDGGSYGDTVHTTRQYKKAICVNCNNDLKLIVDRNE